MLRLNGYTEESSALAISAISADPVTGVGRVLLRVAWVKSEYLIFTVTVLALIAFAAQ